MLGSFTRSWNAWLGCQRCLYVSLSLLAGALLPIQASVNAQLARSLHSAPLAAAVSYGIGALVLLGLLLTRQFGQPTWAMLTQAPTWSLTGGFFGTWYIVSSAYLVPLLGATLTLGLVVGGQAIAGIVTDHFGWLGMTPHRLTPHRRLAIGLLLSSLFLLAQ